MPSSSILSLWMSAYVPDVASIATYPQSDRASVIFVGIVA
jgi:hypothetical protein